MAELGAKPMTGVVQTGDSRAWRRFRKNRGALLGALLVFIVTGTAVVGPYITPYDPAEQFDDAIQKSTGTPIGLGSKYVLGADTLGRDELSRLLSGARISMQVAYYATGIAVVLGLFIGLLTGYFGGFFDSLVMRAVDILLSLPFLLIAIALRRLVESPELWVMYVLLGSLSWMTLARVTRTKTMQVRELEFVQAARALGLGHTRILFRHVLPNVLGPAIALGTILVAQLIIAESAMSFLGLGVQAPAASWGSMLEEGQGILTRDPRLVLIPGVMIVMAVFGFNLLGEGLRDAFDPKE